MSKLYKSEQCVEADPCRLEPADVEAFFINNGFPGEAGKIPPFSTDHPNDTTDPIDSSKDTNVSTEESKDAEGLEDSDAFGDVAAFKEVAVSGDMAAIADGNTVETGATDSENGAPKTELEKLFDVAGHIRSLLEAGHQELGLDSLKTDSKLERDLDFETESAPPTLAPPTLAPQPEIKKGVAKAFNPPKYQSGKAVSTDATVDADAEAETAKERAKLIFTDAQREAGELTEKAKSQADSLLSQAQLQMKQRLEGAEQQAGSILSGAEQQAGQITSSASQQARSLLHDAEVQAEAIMDSSRQKVLQLIENAKSQAEKITGAAEQEAAELKAAAKKESDDLLAAAAKESVNLKNQARQEGLETGRKEGAAQIQKELEQNLATALALVNQAEEERLKRIGSSEPELLKLAVEIARKIIGAELQLNPDAMLEITREALTRVATANNIIVRVNAEDYKQFIERSATLQKAFTEPKLLRIEEDPGVTPGNCFIETEHGNIDPRIKSQLEIIWTELLKAGAIS